MGINIRNQYFHLNFCLAPFNIAKRLIAFYAMGLYSNNSASYAKMIIYENNLQIMNFSSMHVWGSYGGAETFERLIKLAGLAHFEKKTCFSKI